VITNRSIQLGAAEHFELHWPSVQSDQDILTDELIITLRIGLEDLCDSIVSRPIVERIESCRVRFVTRAIELRARRKGLKLYGRKRR
jgi:hypothetical protein